MKLSETTMGRTRDRISHLSLVVIFTSAYVATGMLGLFIQTGHDGITPIWPPSGIALFAFVRYGPRMWPVIAAGIAFLGWYHGIPTLSYAVAAIGNITEAWLGWYLIQRFNIQFGHRLRDTWYFLALPALLAPVSAATIGSLGMILGGIAAWQNMAGMWLMWWLGDLCGILLFTPLLYAWWRRPARARSALRLAEWLLITGFSMLIGWQSFHAPGGYSPVVSNELLFLVTPFLIWAAIRLGLRGATLVSLIACGWVLWGAAVGTGPFAMENNMIMGLIQSSFILVITLTALIVQSLFREHRLDLKLIRDTNEQLEERVGQRTAELQQNELQLSQAKGAAEQANASKTRFLAAASHDLRQPLQAVTSYTQFLAMKNRDPALDDSIHRLETSSKAMNSMLERLLDITRLDTGTLTTEFSVFPIGSLLRELQQQYQHIALEKGITLKYVPCSVPIRSDYTLLREALQNLLDNAITYTDGGRVLIGCRRRGELLRVEVCDSGIGIPETQQKMIFEEYYQLGNPARDRNKGMGMGLAIVNRILTLLGHPIQINSVPGKGSRFAVDVPVAELALQRVAKPSEELIAVHNGARANTILLIDDDAFVLDAHSLLLGTLNYNVITASSAEEALHQVDAEPQKPALIISDYRLPGGHMGTELIRQIRAKVESNLPAIILTGDMTLTENGNLPSNSLLLQKPVRANKLKQSIDRLLEPTAG